MYKMKKVVTLNTYVSLKKTIPVTAVENHIQKNYHKMLCSEMGKMKGNFKHI